MSGERITQAEFARRNGWTKQYVAKLVKQGRIQLEGGKIDPVAAKRAIGQLAEPSTVLREVSPATRTPVPSRATSPTSRAVQGGTNAAQGGMPVAAKAVDLRRRPATMREAFSRQNGQA